jgi:dipeptidyl aminopeptidase/acylaminoacyl peptidase
MKRLLTGLLLLPLALLAQKKPLDHTVYDSWQSIGERMISHDGRWIVYTVTPQEGDAELVVRSADGKYTQQIARGYNALITEDDRFLVFRIRPTFRETREARIKKKRPDEMPKDSIGIVELGKSNVLKVAKVRSYKTPEKGVGWVAYHKEREPVSARAAAAPTQKTVDSLRRTIDSLSLLVTQLKNTKGGNRDGLDADEEPSSSSPAADGSDLVLRDLANGRDRVFRNVVDYAFNRFGQKLVMRIARSPRDSGSANAVILLDLVKHRIDTVLKNGNDFRSFVFTEDGSRLAFLAERDTNTKAPVRHYGLYLYRNGDDSALLLVNKGTPGMKLGMTVSENGQLSFSKSGKRLFFGTAPLPSMKDTSLVDIDLVKLDIWNYKDDYLQSQQLFQLNNELRRSYLAQFDFDSGRLLQLASPALPNVVTMNEGDADYYVAVTDTGRRVESQWSGSTKKDIYALNANTGALTLVKKNHQGNIYPSSTGKYILLYDPKVRHYFVWNGQSLRNITLKITEPLYDVENDLPNDPGPYGIMGWHDGDSALYVYDRYDIWSVDPVTSRVFNLTSGWGKKNKYSYRLFLRDPEQRSFGQQPVLLRRFDDREKTASPAWLHVSSQPGTEWRIRDVTLANKKINMAPSIGPKEISNDSHVLVTQESFHTSPNLFLLGFANTGGPEDPSRAPRYVADERQLTSINPQQAQYNWGSAELYRWKTFDGKQAAGILYKPQNFDSSIP